MRSRSFFRIAAHTGAVAGALGLGLLVRGMLPPNGTAAAPAKTTTSSAKSGLLEETPPVLEQVSTQPLSARPAEERGALRERVRNIHRSLSPVREQLLLRAELVAGIHDVGDFREALEMLAESGTEVSFQQTTVAAMAARLAELDPEGAVAAMELIPDRQVRGLATAKVIDEWAGQDPLGALTFARAQGDNFKSTALQSIFRELAKLDPAAAMADSAEFKGPSMYYGLERTVLNEWWVKDREGALAWAQGREGEERRKMLRTLVEVAGTRDPAAAWQLHQSLETADKPSTWALFGMFNSWARKDPVAAFDAAASETDAVRRGEFMQQLASSLPLPETPGAENPAQALLNRITSEPDRQRFLAGLGQSYLMSNNTQAYGQVLEIASQITDPAQRLDLIKSVGAVWANADAPAASEWINTLQKGPERDGAIGEFVRGTFNTDPAAALTWSASIEDDGKRSRRFMELYPRWLRTDPAAATEWLASQTTLSAADRALMESQGR